MSSVGATSRFSKRAFCFSVGQSKALVQALDDRIQGRQSPGDQAGLIGVAVEAVERDCGHGRAARLAHEARQRSPERPRGGSALLGGGADRLSLLHRGAGHGGRGRRA